MDPAVTTYISQAPAPQDGILSALRMLLQDAVPGTSEAIKWGRPVFATTKDFAYLKSGKTYVTLGFYRADLLKDPKGLLEGTGKTMRHIKLRSLRDVDATMLRTWLKAAAKGGR